MQQISSMPGLPMWLVPTLKWLFVWGEPGLTSHDYGESFGGFITWVKVVGLFSLLGWALSWVVAAFRTRDRSKATGFDIAALVALGGCLLAVLVSVLQTTGQLAPRFVFGVSLSATLGLISGAVLLFWVERSVWTSVRRLGTGSDLVVLAGIHLALVLGLAVAALTLASTISPDGKTLGKLDANALVYAFLQGLRLGATYMGLVVLGKVLWLLVPEVFAMRPRRLYAIAKQSVTEAMRRMWAPYVVLVLFAVILAFTHWFLPASQQRPAELGRIYVGTLTLLCMLLLTVMVTVMAPLSLPQDIQMQTIYTVVSKPVRRLELILGRIVGYMAIVTVLTLIFGGVSLLYLSRNIGGTINEITAQAEKIQATDPDRARVLNEQADQLRTRMSARLPVKGSLTFVDSKGTARIKGIDVGQELEYRSHIEGATEASAVWTYGASVPDPYDPRLRLNRQIPVDLLLKPGTIEAIENRAANLQFGVNFGEQSAKDPNISAQDKAKLTGQLTQTSSEIQQLHAESQKLISQFDGLMARAQAADDAKKADEAESLRDEAAALHSPPIPMEMTFTIYRTTKGRVGEPVYAEIEVENPRTNIPKFRTTFPIHEYYTNKRNLPSSYLVGSLGDLKITIRCKSPTQYLGMAESDFYLLADSGNFGTNFFKGLLGIWLQAMVLATIGVFAGTFLSWPVALLFTVAFFVAGHAAFSVLGDFYKSTIVGGGPFESLIRLITHDNQMTELAGTPGVVVAKTLDAVVTPVMTRMVYLIPNLTSLDVSNTVAEGFAVTGDLVLQNSLIALAYVVPFSIFAYFILKNREVAA